MKSLLNRFMDNNECSHTNYLFGYLEYAKKRMWLKKAELLAICNWKSPRSLHHIDENKEVDVRGITFKAFDTKDEMDKIKILTTLKGVSIPMASAILMFMSPSKYPVIDIRVWEILLELRLVDGNRTGKSLNKNNWIDYLGVVRKYARENRVTARKIERAIFLAHKVHQEGLLY